MNEPFYVDRDGRKCSLERLCRTEPEWAVSQIRKNKDELLRLRAALEKIRRQGPGSYGKAILIADEACRG